MKNFFDKATYIEKTLLNLSLKPIDTSFDILFKCCDYEEDYGKLPELTNFVPYLKGMKWGGQKDSHAWFYASVNLQEYKGKIIRVVAHTDRCGDDIWDACNPQFIAYCDGDIKQGLDVKHTYFDICGGKQYDLHFYGHSGTQVADELDFSLKLFEVDQEILKVYFDINIAIETLKLCDEKDERYSQMKKALLTIFDIIDFRRAENFRVTLKEASEFFDKYFVRFKSTEPSKVTCVGSTHIDIGWLWRIRQTEEKAVRSFSTVLNLMDKYPEYNFFSSQPILYEMVKRRAPMLFDKIKEKVNEGRWETDGAMWLEPDCNLPSGESLVRQILYGKKYFKENFNKDSTIAWLVDSFGFNASLPQIFKKSGIDFFITSKLNWNDTNTMPNDLFYWQGIDGTKIPCYLISTQDYNGEEFVRVSVYNAYVRPSMQKGTWDRFRERDITGEVLQPFGYGDGGGGPAAEQFEQLRRMKYGAFDCPASNIGRVKDFKDRVLNKIEEAIDLPIWNGELYLEFHRGVYTSIAKIKKQNRTNEYLLQNAEFISSLSNKLLGKEYQTQLLQENWLKLLTTQFHDILPGSAIKEVYDETDKINEQISSDIKPLIERTLNNIVENIHCGDGVVVFNPTSFNIDGEIEVDNTRYLVSNIPSKGYKFIANNELTVCENHVLVKEKCLENNCVLVAFDDNYNIVSYYDKKINRELIQLGKKANILAVYEDHPKEYDAWELENYYNEKCDYIDNVQEVEIIPCGFKIKKQYLQTIITQEITLANNSSMLTFKTKVDWKERHMLLKSVFPLDINTDKAICDIPFGNIERATTNNTSWERAKYEVSAHKYVDLSENDYGVALINDCKYGYGVKNNELSLSLLRAPEYPFEGADYGEHEFTYVLYAHQNNAYKSDVYKQALLINNPLIAVTTNAHNGNLQPNYSFVSCDAENVIIDGIKQSEDKKGFIVRLFERMNSLTSCTIMVGFDIKKACLCNLVEEREQLLDIKENSLRLTIKPYEIITLYLQ